MTGGCQRNGFVRSIRRVAAAFLMGMQRWSDLKTLNLTEALHSLLTYPQQQQQHFSANGPDDSHWADYQARLHR